MTKSVFTKETKHRSRYLLDMARGRTCLLRFPLVHYHDTDTTVACHANWLEMGKGKSTKAHDFLSVWGCCECHSKLDQGSYGTKEERKAIWWEGYKRQLEMWQKIVKNDYFSPREQKEAAKAITKFIEWRDAHKHLFDEGDWQLEYKYCIDCLETVIHGVWDGYTNGCHECEKRMIEGAKVENEKAQQEV